MKKVVAVIALLVVLVSSVAVTASAKSSHSIWRYQLRPYDGIGAYPSGRATIGVNTSTHVRDELASLEEATSESVPSTLPVVIGAFARKWWIVIALVCGVTGLIAGLRRRHR